MRLSIFKFLCLAILAIAPISLIHAADTASLLPNAVQQYLNNNADPVSSGSVTYYVPNTTTLKTIWQDPNKTTPMANPVILNAAGRPPGDQGIYGDGDYQQVLKDKNGNTIWNRLTSSVGSGGGSGGGGTLGDGNLVGTILPWSGLVAPTNYVFASGQELNRTTYSIYFNAATQVENITCTGGSPTLTSVADTSQLSVGAAVEASCVPSGSLIISKTISSVTLNNNATVDITVSARFFPYGNGNGVTTFNTPNLNGKVLVGRNNMGGVVYSGLTSTYYGADPNGLGINGGSQNKTLLLANLPPYTPLGTITNGAITTNINGSPVVGNGTSGVQGGATFPNSVTGVGTITASSTQAASTFTGTAQGGSSTPFSLIQPSQTINYIVKILPDASLSISRCSELLDAGTACTANTGTSNHNVPFLDGVNTWSNPQTFNSTINNLSFSDPGSAKLVQIQSNLTVANTPATFIGNPNAFGADINNFTIPGLSLKATIDPTNDLLLLYDATGSNFKKVTAGQLASIGVAGVSSLGGMTGGITCGTGLTCATSTISNSGVLSFAGRLGVVVPTTNDYSAAQVSYTAPGTGGALQQVSDKLNKEVWVNDYGAKCDGSTPDDTAFANARNAAVALGVELRFKGYCFLNNTFTISSAITIRGVGQNSSAILAQPTQDGIDINTSGTVILKDFSIIYNSGSNPGTVGLSKSTPGAAQSVGDRYENLQIFGAYTIAIIDKANVWVMNNCLFSLANNGIFIDNSFNFDNGDMVLSNNTITAVSNAAIVYYGGGGLRLISNKISGTFTAGVEMNLGGGGTPTTSTTSDLIAVGNSIESTSVSSIGFYLHRSLSNLQFYNVVLTGNQLLTNTGVFVPTDVTGNWITNFTVVGMTWLAQGNPGGALYNMNSVNGVNITGGSADSSSSVNSIYSFGSNISGKINVPSHTGTFGASSNSSASIVVNDQIGVAFADLPSTAAAGSQIFITNGTTGSLPCTGGGSGSTAFRQAGSWKCF